MVVTLSNNKSSEGENESNKPKSVNNFVAFTTNMMNEFEDLNESDDEV